MSGNSVFTLQHPSKILFDLSLLVGTARCTYVQEVKIQLLKIRGMILLAILKK